MKSFLQCLGGIPNITHFLMGAEPLPETTLQAGKSPEALPVSHPDRVARRDELRRILKGAQKRPVANFQPSTPLKKTGLTH